MKKIKIGRWIVLFIILYFLYTFLFGSFRMPDSIIIKSGDTFARFLSSLDTVDRMRVKMYVYLAGADASSLAVGTYTFTGTYSPAGLVTHILAGPQQQFVRYTVLEGWSIYDIDADLTAKGYINAGEYITYVTDRENIILLQNSYPFLQNVSSLQTFEGFLYPDTYFIDNNGSFVTQLVSAQLDTFATKVWAIYSGDVPSFVQNHGLDWYDIVTLASVVQKEERTIANQPTIAGVFLRRMTIGMRLDADITLCYYYRRPYSDCTPGFIARALTQEQPYNTRQVRGLPPTPIANIPASAIDAVLHFSPSAYLYYLHDIQGRIWFAETLEQHNINKARYLP